MRYRKFIIASVLATLTLNYPVFGVDLEPTLDRLNGKPIPNTTPPQNYDAASAYRFSASSEGNSNTVKVYSYDDSTGNTTKEYYRVVLKERVFGNADGDERIYYGWTVDDDGKYSLDYSTTYSQGGIIVRYINPENHLGEYAEYYKDQVKDPQLIESYPEKYFYYGFNKDSDLSNVLFDNITITGNSSRRLRGGILYNGADTIGTEGTTVDADFVGIKAPGFYRIEGAVIFNDGIINSITGNFINNEALCTGSTTYNSNGGAISNQNNGDIGKIEGHFINNASNFGGAIFNSSASNIGDITGDFIGNRAEVPVDKNGGFGGAIYNSVTNDDPVEYRLETTIGNIKGSFVNNSATHSGGAIFNSARVSTAQIGNIDGDFIGNSTKSTNTAGINYTSGGAIANNVRAQIGDVKAIIGELKGNYIGNSSSLNGGAIYNHAYLNGGTSGLAQIGSITGDFIGSFAAQDGGAIYNSAEKEANATIGRITGDFIGNIAKGNGGAIYNRSDNEQDTLGNITGLFIGNQAGLNGGAIYNSAGSMGRQNEEGTVIGGIVNSSFYDNRVINNVDNLGHGGAIYTDKDLNIIANDGYKSVFSGNYVQNADKTIESSAVYIGSADAKLYLIAYQGATLEFDDMIRGENGYQLFLKGNTIESKKDTTGTIILNNKVMETIATMDDITLKLGITGDRENIGTDKPTTSDVLADVDLTVNSGHIDVVNNNYTNYNVEKLTSIGGEEGGKYSIDIGLYDEDTGLSDTFTVGAGSNGTVTLSNLVVSTLDGLKVSDENEYIIQILKAKDNNIELAFEDGLHNITEATPEMTSDTILAQEFELYTKDTTNDSIRLVGWRDNLAAWAELEVEEGVDKTFTINTGDKQFLTRDIEGGLRGTNITIQGTDGNVLDLNGKNLFENISDSQNVELSNLNLYNAKNINNEGTLTLDTVGLASTSKITNDNSLTIKGKTDILGTVTSNKNGTLAFNEAETNIVGTVEKQNISSANSTINLHNKENFKDNSLSLDGSTLNLFNLGLTQLHFNEFEMGNGSSINVDSVDVDLENQTMGMITADKYNNIEDPNITVGSLNVIKDAKDYFASTLFTDNDILAHGVHSDITEAEGPIFRYAVSYTSNGSGGQFNFVRGDYNPAVMSSSVSQLAGGYASMIQSLEYAFEHSDTFSALPYHIRKDKFNSHKYAINEADCRLPNYYDEFNSKALWFRPYTSFENIPMKNGYDVDTVLYGSYAGGDTELIPLKNGWNTVFSGYVGYTGSSQSYQGIHTYQNGIIGGVTQTLYKENFYTAITASVGSSIGETSNKYGDEDFTMLMAGAASKTGYNFEFNDGKFIIQPTLLMAYTMINTFDYTNSAGVSIKSEPLHMLQVHPYIKFVQNTENGWQPYLSAGFVYNVMGSTQIMANEFSLPSLSIKPYAEYGLGLQKLWNDKYTGYLQAMVRNGGRNGIAFTAGFRWLLGHDNDIIEKVNNDNNIKPVSNQIKTVKTEPEKVKAVKKAENKEKVQKVQKVKQIKSKEKSAFKKKLENLFNKTQNIENLPTGERKVFKQLTPEQRQKIISKS